MSRSEKQAWKLVEATWVDGDDDRVDPPAMAMHDADNDAPHKLILGIS